MRILRFIERKIHTILFFLTSAGIRLEGKGIVKNIKCCNRGNENVAIIDAGATLTNCSFFFKGNNNTIHVGCGTHLENVTFWFEDDNNKIDIGKNVWNEGGMELAACESKEITIGDNCMVASNVKFRTTDSHSIIDMTGKRLNPGDNIYIGANSWICLESLILKGADIPEGCIVGARSTVTSKLKAMPNCLITGAPAKVIKEGVTSCRERI